MSRLHSESRRRRVHSAGERVVLAIAVATPGGIGSLTIRLLAQHLGRKPMAIRARLFNRHRVVPTLRTLDLSPKLNCRIPCMSPHAATQPPLVIASGAASGIPQQPLPAVASELAECAGPIGSQTGSHTPQPFVLVSVLIRTPRGLGALLPITHRTTLDA